MPRHVDTPRATRASAALSERFSSKYGAQKECSEKTGIKQARLSKIASAKAFPRADEGALIEQHEGIPAGWWAEQIAGSDPEAA
jgi:hypothetical protein